MRSPDQASLHGASGTQSGPHPSGKQASAVAKHERAHATFSPAGHALEAAVARHILRCHRKREAVFAQPHYADPVWDIMLDLFDAQTSGKDLAASSLLVGTAVSLSTGLRRLRKLVTDGILIADPDPSDGRRTFLRLTPDSYNRVADWLSDFSRTFPEKA